MTDEKPKIAVGVSVLLLQRFTDGDAFLMAKRKNNSASGFISTPGGRLETNETVLACAFREFQEETGAQLDGEPEIIGWREHFRYGNHYIMFYVRALSCTGTVTNCIPDKSEDWAWYRRTELTEENCTEPQDILALALKPQQTSHITFDEYQDRTGDTAVYPHHIPDELAGVVYCSLGLGGEVGEVLGKIKKLIRDGDTPEKRAAIVTEIGDSLWYIPRLLTELGRFRMSTTAEKNIEKLAGRKERGTLHGSGDYR